MSSKNLAIAVLSITAAILFVGLVVVSVSPKPATASNISSYGGDYTITVGRLTRDTELLYVIDNTVQGLTVYGITRTGVPAITAQQTLVHNTMPATP